MLAAQPSQEKKFQDKTRKINLIFKGEEMKK
jgi:hypothetical protein